MESRKQNVSVRLSASDIKRVKEISDRLGVKKSDLVRFFVKNMLAKVMPLHDANIRGVDLLPTVLDHGVEIIRYFDLDSEDLEEIINCDENDIQRKVSKEDIDLIVMSSISENYAHLRLGDLVVEGNKDKSVAEFLKEILSKKYLNVVEDKAADSDPKLQVQPERIHRIAS